MTASPSPRRRLRIFRWKAIGPLLLFLLVLGVLLALFAEPVARDTVEEASTELLGTQVDLAKLDLYPRVAAVDLRGLQVADPFEPRRNLLEADEIRLKLDPVALSEKKIVVERFTLHGMRFGQPRKRPARPVRGNGFAPQLLRSVRAWGKQFDVPLLQLTPIDTIRQLALDPTQLTTVRQAQALVARTDSTRQALEQGFQALAIRGTVDSARALAQRLAATDPARLGVQGTAQAVEQARRSLSELERAGDRLERLETNVRGGVQLLVQGVESVDSARRQDYAFARSLLKLPSLDAPEIGEAFFGRVSIDRFQQALYWTELARRYMPPGLLPREEPGPKRLRRDGTTVRFPKEREYPSFLMRFGQIDFAIEGDSPLRGAYEATVQGLTSAPALYGRPMLVAARRRAAGSAVGSIDVQAVIDHVTAPSRDSVVARLRGVKLPTFALPGMPFRVAPGTGGVDLAFALRGDRLFGRWAISSNQVAWATDTTGRRLNEVERLVWRVISGLNDLRVTAEVSGPVRRPRLAVTSNLDRAIAARLEAVIGEELAKAERLARAKVDSLVEARVAPVRREAEALRAEATQRVAAERQRLDEAQRQLEAEVKRLAGPAGDLIRLPKVRL